MKRAASREIRVGGGGARGLRLRAAAWESPGVAGPSLLLLHATSFCGSVFGPVLAAAAALPGGSAALAVAPDARGHGESDAPDAASGFAWPSAVDDAVAWIDAVAAAGGPGLVLVGHSSGGTVALAAAARRPGFVRGVLAVEPVLFEAPPPGTDADSYPGSRFMAETARRRRPRFASRAEARERLAARAPFAAFAPAALDAFLDGGLAEEEGGARLRCAPAHEAACYEGAGALDLWPELPRVVAPVRLVLGERGFVAAALRERLRAALPGTGIDVVPGGTHFVALEKPREVGEALARFLRERRDVDVA